MANQLYQKQDLPSLYKSEGAKYAELAISILTTTGSGSFVSVSSGITYNYTGGQQDLFNQLAIVLDDYNLTATDWNLVRSFIYGQGTPIENGVQTKLVKVNGVLTEVRLFKADLTTLIAKTVLNRQSGALISVDSIIYDDSGLVEICRFVDILNKINGNLDNITRTVVVS